MLLDAVFERLTGIYGNRFTNMWANIDPNTVRVTWAREIAGYDMDSVRYALEHLNPDQPPTALQFRKLCNAAPSKTLMIEHKGHANPQRIADELAKLHQKSQVDGKEWARAILARDRAGECVPRISVRFAREALGIKP